jgi:hypothetical protein
MIVFLLQKATLDWTSKDSRRQAEGRAVWEGDLGLTNAPWNNQ